MEDKCCLGQTRTESSHSDWSSLSEAPAAEILDAEARWHYNT